MDHRIDAIVFDMDGTLVDSVEAVPGAYIAFVAETTGQVLTPAEIVDLYALGPPPVMLSHLLGRPANTADVDRYHELVSDSVTRLRPYDGIPELLAELRDRLPLGVFTGATTRAAEILLTATGLISSFGAVLGADEVPRHKPAPDGVIEACVRLGVPVENSLYIGDSPIDALAARAAGAVAVGAGWGHQFDATVDAHVVVDKPGDVLTLLDA